MLIFDSGSGSGDEDGDGTEEGDGEAAGFGIPGIWWPSCWPNTTEPSVKIRKMTVKNREKLMH
jgi:hypothetical protein